MVSIMVYLQSSAEDTLKKLGELLRMARRRQNLTIAQVAEKMSVSRPTVMSLERGNPNTSAGLYFSALWILNMSHIMYKFTNLEDSFGHMLQDHRLPKKIRHKKPNNNNF
jgi:transcriptional regulator with XRE-family HTH domain